MTKMFVRDTMIFCVAANAYNIVVSYIFGSAGGIVASLVAGGWCAYVAHKAKEAVRG